MNLLPRLARLSLLDRGFSIRVGQSTDIDACDRIARQQERLKASSLGWVRRDDYKDFHVALLGDEVVGAVIVHSVQRGIDAGSQVVKALFVDPRYDCIGIGRNLLYSVECPIRLRCPQFVNGGEPNPANVFYKNAGFKLNSIETEYRGGEKRGQRRTNPLNVWELPVLAIFVMGSSRDIPEVARLTGWAYGTRECEIPRDWPYQVDINLDEETKKGNWRAYDWDGYIRKIEHWKPFSALVVDYFEPAQCETMLDQVRQLRDAGVSRILVCPKFHGAVADIPVDCIVAISIPSRYAGFVPAGSEIAGRKLHLLGGSPTKWFGSRSGRKNRESTGYCASLTGAGGRIISVDGNSHEAAAQTGTYWLGGRWQRPSQGLFFFGNRFETMIVSGRSILSDLHKVKGLSQSALFVEESQ